MSESRPSIKTLTALAKTITTLTDPRLADWASDSRLGVQRLAAMTRRRLEHAQAQEAAFQARLHYERAFWQQGQLVAGVDEVGRGPLAGPVVTAAVILPDTFDLPLVNDSKQLTAHERDTLAPLIREQAVAVGIGVAASTEIDQLNIYEATRVAMKRAVVALSPQPDHLIVDAMQIPVSLPQTRLIKGDAKSASVAAASIVAKVYRDQLMADYDRQYPGYGFAKNAGYGTKEHLAGLNRLGPSPIHRHSFAPVKNASQSFLRN